jgi:hypothetical protein
VKIKKKVNFQRKTINGKKNPSLRQAGNIEQGIVKSEAKKGYDLWLLACG